MNAGFAVARRLWLLTLCAGVASALFPQQSVADPAPIEGTWWAFRKSESQTGLDLTRLVFEPKTVPVPAGAKLPEFVFAKAKECKMGNIVFRVCDPKTIPSFPSDADQGYWAPNPFGDQNYVWVPHHSKYPQYLSPSAYPTKPPVAGWTPPGAQFCARPTEALPPPKPSSCCAKWKGKGLKKKCVKWK